MKEKNSKKRYVNLLSFKLERFSSNTFSMYLSQRYVVVARHVFFSSVAVIATTVMSMSIMDLLVA